MFWFLYETRHMNEARHSYCVPTIGKRAQVSSVNRLWFFLAGRFTFCSHKSCHVCIQCWTWLHSVPQINVSSGIANMSLLFLRRNRSVAKTSCFIQIGPLVVCCEETYIYSRVNNSPNTSWKTTTWRYAHEQPVVKLNINLNEIRIIRSLNVIHKRTIIY